MSASAGGMPLIFVYASMKARYWPWSFVNLATKQLQPPNFLDGPTKRPKRRLAGSLYLGKKKREKSSMFLKVSELGGKIERS